jgi:peptidyl-prolyl cis-trans isomerase B (cyclophilin B)
VLRPIDYRDVVMKTADPVLVEMDTERGPLQFEIACPEAPLTCVNFLQLANQGFYDGLTFHHLEPGVLLQAGDPRGDGWGGVEYTVRDEPNRLPFTRGTLGMTRSVEDSAGSQFFIALAPRPELSGELTAFGQLVMGEEVLDQIGAGDVILKVREVEARSSLTASGPLQAVR